MQTCSDGLRFYIRTATERLLFFQRAEGKRVRNTINSVGEEGQRDHRNDEQAVPRRADEKEKRKDNRQHGQNNQPTAVGIAPELIGFANAQKARNRIQKPTT